MARVGKKRRQESEGQPSQKKNKDSSDESENQVDKDTQENGGSVDGDVNVDQKTKTNEDVDTENKDDSSDEEAENSDNKKASTVKKASPKPAKKSSKTDGEENGKDDEEVDDATNESELPKRASSKRKASVKPVEAKVAKTPKKGAKSKTKKASNKKEKEEVDSSDSEAEYEVEKIIDSRTKKGVTEFLVHWKGWSKSHDSWLPEDNLSCNVLIKEYLDKKKENKQEKKPATSSRGKGNLRDSPSKTVTFQAKKTRVGLRTKSKRITYHDQE